MSIARKKTLLPPPLVALCNWLVPGAGYVLIGQRSRGLVVGITIIILFVLGLMIGGIRVVDAPNVINVQGVLSRPWFIGQFFAGPMALVSHWIGSSWGGPDGAPFSHARVYDIGTLYTAVAGMLNLMATLDSAYRASNEGAR